MRTQQSRLLWRITGLISLLSFLLFAVGFALALNPSILAPAKTGIPDKEQHPQVALPLPSNGQLTIVTLGDSLTRGTGDANGQGYVGLVRQALEKQTGHKPLLTNLAIKGLQSAGLLKQLQQQQVQAQLATANLILFTIGGNDMFQESGEVENLDEKKLAQAADQLAANFDKILKQIRSLNKEATVVYLSLYNPFGNTEAKADTAPPVLAWNSKAEAIASAYSKVLVVPTYDLFVQKEAAYLYTDHFHPNSDGYARMADRVLQALK